ncbi:hypothetical protein V8C86DRAFT_2885304, partial [Haematococcus lacustris]
MDPGAPSPTSKIWGNICTGPTFTTTTTTTTTCQPCAPPPPSFRLVRDYQCQPEQPHPSALGLAMAPPPASGPDPPQLLLSPLKPGKLAGKTKKAAGPEGVVHTPLADRIASLGSSILASLKEKALALDGTREGSQPRAMISSKMGEKRAVFRNNKVLPTPTMYALVHPKPSSSPAAASPSRKGVASTGQATSLAGVEPGSPTPLSAVEERRMRIILQERQQRERDRQQREAERAQREALRSLQHSPTAPPCPTLPTPPSPSNATTTPDKTQGQPTRPLPPLPWAIAVPAAAPKASPHPPAAIADPLRCPSPSASARDPPLPSTFESVAPAAGQGSLCGAEDGWWLTPPLAPLTPGLPPAPLPTPPTAPQALPVLDKLNGSPVQGSSQGQEQGQEQARDRLGAGWQQRQGSSQGRVQGQEQQPSALLPPVARAQRRPPTFLQRLDPIVLPPTTSQLLMPVAPPSPVPT